MKNFIFVPLLVLLGKSIDKFLSKILQIDLLFLFTLLASSGHASPLPSNITSTILFDQGFVLAEGFDLDTIEYSDSTWGGFLFKVTTRSESMWSAPTERLKTKGNLRSSFAVDTFKRKAGDRTSNKDFCKTHSNSSMRLLDSCEGRIAIRMMTAEEKRRTEQLKNELTSELSFQFRL